MKVLTILGARPQFIKASSLSRELAKYNDIEEIIVHTGQHYDSKMSDIFFDELSIPYPKYNLNIHEENHGVMTGRMINEIEKVTIKENPDWVLVFGDTNSTLAGALVANKLNIKLAHIEAGMRSFNHNMPEEVNRIIVDRLSNLLLCSSKTAIQNLANEGYQKPNFKYLKIGDVMLDSINHYKNFAKEPEEEINTPFILCTLHRAENTDNAERLNSIFDALKEISLDTQVLIPIHPRTLKIVHKLKISLGRIKLISPVSYLEMIWLLDNCNLVMTDSGGLQKEAYFMKKLCLTLRDETEWTELVDLKVNILVGANKDKILKTFYDNSKNSNIDSLSNIYGDGKASSRAVNEILNF